MKYYNLKIKVLLKEDLKNTETYEKISNLISFAMLKEETLKKLHIKIMYFVIYIQ